MRRSIPMIMVAVLAIILLAGCVGTPAVNGNKEVNTTANVSANVTSNMTNMSAIVQNHAQNISAQSVVSGNEIRTTIAYDFPSASAALDAYFSVMSDELAKNPGASTAFALFTANGKDLFYIKANASDVRKRIAGGSLSDFMASAEMSSLLPPEESMGAWMVSLGVNDASVSYSNGVVNISYTLPPKYTVGDQRTDFIITVFLKGFYYFPLSTKMILQEKIDTVANDTFFTIVPKDFAVVETATHNIQLFVGGSASLAQFMEGVKVTSLFSYVSSKPVCGDGECEGAEDYSSCSSDCQKPIVCGDGVCEGNESHTSCSADCPGSVACGDGTCDDSENYTSCPADCQMPIACGDGICDANETCSSCAVDCGCTAGQMCCANSCTQLECYGSSDCNDGNQCTTDACSGMGSCYASCIHTAIPGCGTTVTQKEVVSLHSMDSPAFSFVSNTTFPFIAHETEGSIDIAFYYYCRDDNSGAAAKLCGVMADMGAVDMDSVTSIPGGAWMNAAMNFIDCGYIYLDHVYVVKTRAGTYAKFLAATDMFTQEEYGCTHLLTLEYVYPFG